MDKIDIKKSSVVDEIKSKIFNTPTAGLILLWCFLWISAAIFVPKFATIGNVTNLFRQSSDLVVAAIGIMFVLLIGGIDLSIGSIFGLSSVLISIFIISGVPVIPAILLVLVVAAIVGLINGVLAQYGRIPSFISTLGMYYILFAIAQMVSNGSALRLPSGTLLEALSRGSFLGLPYVVIVAIIVAVVGWLILNRTAFGRQVISVGMNQETSRLSGISIFRTVIIVFLISSVLATISSLILTARVQTGEPALGGLTATFEVITAAVVGGTSLFGGRGTVVGVVIGAIIIRTIGNCITLLNINPLLYQAVMGLLILIALIFEAIRTRQKGGIE